MELKVLVMCMVMTNIARKLSAQSTAPVKVQSQCIIPIGKSGTAKDTDGVPTSFTYACALSGTIHISINSFTQHGEFKIRGIEPSLKVLPNGHCQAFNCTKNTTHINVTGCQHDVPVLLDFDKMNDTTNGIVIGGKSSKRFKLVCSSSFVANITYAVTPQTIGPSFSQATVTYMPALMTIELTNAGKPVTSAVVGEKLQLKISINEQTYKIKPTYCEATNGKEDNTKKTLKLWSEEGSKHSADDEVFDKKWNLTDGKTVTTSLYAFRFVDTDNVFITCTLRMCLITSDDAKKCNETYNGHRRRRSDSLQLKHKSVTTKIHVYDIPNNKANGQKELVSVVSIVTVLVIAGGRFWT